MATMTSNCRPLSWILLAEFVPTKVICSQLNTVWIKINLKLYKINISYKWDNINNEFIWKYLQTMILLEDMRSKGHKNWWSNKISTNSQNKWHTRKVYNGAVTIDMMPTPLSYTDNIDCAVCIAIYDDTTVQHRLYACVKCLFDFSSVKDSISLL